MINIELELVSDVNLDQALGILARTLVTGRRSHRAAAVTGRPRSPGRGMAVEACSKTSPACPQASRCHGSSAARHAITRIGRATEWQTPHNNLRRPKKAGKHKGNLPTLTEL